MQQERENADLVKKVDAAKPRIKDQLERGNLLNEVQELRRFYNAVPDDIKREAASKIRLPQQRTKGQEIG